MVQPPLVVLLQIEKEYLGLPKTKVQQANYFGSRTQASTIRVGSFNGEEIYAPFKSLLPMVNPDDIVFGGWDISHMNLVDAIARAKVLDIDLQRQLRPYMESMVPLPGIYDPDFIATNQGSRANNMIKGTKKEQVQQIMKDIREFKEANKFDDIGPHGTKIIIFNLWHNNDGMLELNFDEDDEVGFRLDLAQLLKMIHGHIPYCTRGTKQAPTGITTTMSQWQKFTPTR